MKLLHRSLSRATAAACAHNPHPRKFVSCDHATPTRHCKRRRKMINVRCEQLQRCVVYTRSAQGIRLERPDARQRVDMAWVPAVHQFATTASNIQQALRDDLLCMRGDVRTGAFLAGTRPGGRLQAQLTPPRVRSRREGAQAEPSVRSSHRVSCVRSVHQVRRIFRLSNSRDLGDPDPLGQRLIACAETELCSKQAV